MRILVSNDDGIYSPGIACLARVAARFGEVHVVAPDVEQSSASHAVTASRPPTYRPTPQVGGLEAFRVNGTPADCVALGIYNWKERRPRPVRHQPGREHGQWDLALRNAGGCQAGDPVRHQGNRLQHAGAGIGAGLRRPGAAC